jgi:hypothetical protein
VHSHFSVLTVANTFLAVLMAGTLWRLSSLHLIACSNPALGRLGSAMAFQY